MGVDVQTFNVLLNPFTIEWEGKTIPRSDVNPHGEPQVARRSLDAAGCLALVLHWLSSTMSAISLQLIFAITPLVFSCYLNVGLQFLMWILRKLKHAHIIWPTTEVAIKTYCMTIEKKFPLLKKCFGFVDGLNLPILVSDNDE